VRKKKNKRIRYFSCSEQDDHPAIGVKDGEEEKTTKGLFGKTRYVIFYGEY